MMSVVHLTPETLLQLVDLFGWSQTCSQKWHTPMTEIQPSSSLSISAASWLICLPGLGLT